MFFINPKTWSVYSRFKIQTRIWANINYIFCLDDNNEVFSSVFYIFLSLFVTNKLLEMMIDSHSLTLDEKMKMVFIFV